MCALVTGVQTCALPVTLPVVSVGLPIVPSCMVGLEVEPSGIGVVASGVVVLPWGIEGSDVEPSGIGVAVPVSGDMVPLSGVVGPLRSEEHTSELQSLMRTSYAVFCLKKKNKTE